MRFCCIKNSIEKSGCKFSLRADKEACYIWKNAFTMVVNMLKNRLSFKGIYDGNKIKCIHNSVYL